MLDVRNLDLLEVVHFSISSRAQNSSSAAVSWKTPTPIRHAIPYVPSVTGVPSIQKKKRRSDKFRSILWCPSSPENSWDSSFLRVGKSALSYQQIATSGPRGGSAQRLETSGAGTCSSEEIYVLRARAVNRSGTAARHFGRISNSFFSHRVAHRPSRLWIPRLSLLVAFLPVNSNRTLCVTLT